MPKAVFWNLGGASQGPRWIEALIGGERPDLAAFSEVSKVRRREPAGYQRIHCGARLHLLAPIGSTAKIVEDGRLEGYAFVDLGGATVVFCHLMSSLNGGRYIRQEEMRGIASRLQSAVSAWQKVVVLGDLNCDPFDPDLNAPAYLNARQTFVDARLHVHRKSEPPRLVALGHSHLGRRVAGDGSEFAGSFLYASAGRGELRWRLLDHALVSDDLEHAEMRVLDRLDGVALVQNLGTAEKKREHPDHLPIVVEW